MTKRTINDLDLRGKRVFIRVDFNVPLKEGVVTDDTRIRETLPTLRLAIEKGGRLVLAAHLGRLRDFVGHRAGHPGGAVAHRVERLGANCSAARLEPVGSLGAPTGPAELAAARFRLTGPVRRPWWRIRELRLNIRRS